MAPKSSDYVDRREVRLAIEAELTEWASSIHALVEELETGELSTGDPALVPAALGFLRGMEAEVKRHTPMLLQCLDAVPKQDVPDKRVVPKLIWQGIEKRGHIKKHELVLLEFYPDEAVYWYL